MKTKKKLLVPVMVVALVLVTIGGTLAWLKAETKEVKNTFTVGNVAVALEEKAGGLDKQFKMVPGSKITKDPIVTLGGTEKAWLFVKVDAHNTKNYLTYEIDKNWKALDEAKYPGVYYIAEPVIGNEYHVLVGDKVNVLDTVNNKLMGEAQKDAPTLTFKAYAIQKENFGTAEEAWTEAQKVDPQV